MSILSRIGRALHEYARIISISKKPDKKEFVSIIKVCGLGILLMGVIGFVIQLVYSLIGSI